MVVDASAVIEVLRNTPKGEAVADRIADAGGRFHAPHLLDIEVTNGLRRLCVYGDFHPEQGLQMLDLLNAMRIVRHPHGDLLARVWHLRNTVKSYDALYIALAELLDVPLVTTDGKLAKAHGHTARIE